MTTEQIRRIWIAKKAVQTFHHDCKRVYDNCDPDSNSFARLVAG